MVVRRKASSTMMGVAIFRALHPVLNAEPTILKGALAVSRSATSHR
jgi:hypothetical protein